MRNVLTRMAALVAGVVVVASCDARLTTPVNVTGTGSTSTSSPSGTKPSIVIDSPLVGQLINVGDSILVTLRLQDTRALTNATIAGFTQAGSVDLGTFTQTQRYKTVAIPVAGAFRAGLHDTTVRRYLQPISATDTSLDSLIIVTVATDSAGAADTAHVRVNLVTGPKVSIVSPANGDSVPAGTAMAVSARATKADGVGRIDVRVQGEANWPTKLDTTFTTVFGSAPRDTTATGIITVPQNAPARGRITITATALDVDRQPGSATPIGVFIRGTPTAAPRVTQVVAPRLETSDSVTISATGQSIAAIGFVIRDSVGGIVKRDSVVLPAPLTSNATRTLGINLSTATQGQRLTVTGFAVDGVGRTGFAVSSATTVSATSLAVALADTTLIVFGHTYKIPHSGTIADLVVDPVRGNVLLSNMDNNRLEVWRNSTQSFDSLGVAVGSLPWGLFVSNNPDTLLVANSGGTNLSRVFLGSGDPRTIHEDLAARMLTRNAYIFQAIQARDPNTNKVTLSVTGPFLFSDRPQYVGQLQSGLIYFSTRPTTEAPAGTVRWIDPTQSIPDLHQVIIFKTATGDNNQFVITNADSVFVRPSLPNSSASDTLVIYDHKPGTNLPSDSARSANGVVAAIAAMQAVNGSDVAFITGVDIAGSGLTDTTYLAVSGDRKWIGFGSGNTSNAGQVFMTNSGTFFSPLTTQQDILNNASERVFGIALDAIGSTIAVHGAAASYFANVEIPFHLRLQGEALSNITGGGGIAFHPNAQVFTNGTFSTNDATRLAFVASIGSDNNSGEIDIIDAAFYVQRGRLQIKNKLFGPLRATNPLPGDPSNVILRIFGLSANGMVSVPLTAADIKPVP